MGGRGSRLHPAPRDRADGALAWLGLGVIVTNSYYLLDAHAGADLGGDGPLVEFAQRLHRPRLVRPRIILRSRRLHRHDRAGATTTSRHGSVFHSAWWSGQSRASSSASRPPHTSSRAESPVTPFLISAAGGDTSPKSPDAASPSKSSRDRRATRSEWAKSESSAFARRA